MRLPPGEAHLLLIGPRGLFQIPTATRTSYWRSGKPRSGHLSLISGTPLSSVSALPQSTIISYGCRNTQGVGVERRL